VNRGFAGHGWGAFLDRDGTIIHDANYIRDPDDVALLPGAAAAIAKLNHAGAIVVVVTNQSGIARGSLSTDDYESVRRRIDDLLALEGGGARIDATYVCPHFPEISGPCDCRKPGLKLYRDAIADLGIDPTRSVFVGDRWRDVAPGVSLGGRPIFLDVASSPPEDRERVRAEGLEVAHSLGEAVDRFLDALPASAAAQ
jgi:D-glycero-D-manno-heptose 1,7-bisphosphate phosphatase